MRCRVSDRLPKRTKLGYRSCALPTREWGPGRTNTSRRSTLFGEGIPSGVRRGVSRLHHPLPSAPAPGPRVRLAGMVCPLAAGDGCVVRGSNGLLLPGSTRTTHPSSRPTRRSLVHGNLGSGKSTLAKALRDEHAFAYLPLDELYVELITAKCPTLYFEDLKGHRTTLPVHSTSERIYQLPFRARPR